MMHLLFTALAGVVPLTNLSIPPNDSRLFLILPGIAGLVVVLGAGLLTIIFRRWRGDGGNGQESTWPAKLRYALLAFAIWLALSIFLILDVGFALSVYLQFVAAYAAFWLLIGALLLVGLPGRERLLILGLFIVVLVSMSFVDWNSRKPFLRDLYRVEQGMTVEQVEQLMADYTIGTGWPACPLGLVATEPASETLRPSQPDRLVYRHTDEGWGNSDWGEVRFENGRVVEIHFLPD
jgi:hypothetical protein